MGSESANNEAPLGSENFKKLANSYMGAFDMPAALIFPENCADDLDACSQKFYSDVATGAGKDELLRDVALLRGFMDKHPEGETRQRAILLESIENLEVFLHQS